MSVIAAICSSQTASTWVASDTVSSSGNLHLSVGPKWVTRQSWGVGVAGHLRTVNVFHRHADKLLKDLPDAYEFTRRARDLLTADGYRRGKDDAGPCEFGQMLMLASPRSVWTIGVDFSLTEVPTDSLWAEGSGREISLGAAHALQTRDSNISPKDLIRLAVETAIALEAGCGGSVWIAELAANTGRKG